MTKLKTLTLIALLTLLSSSMVDAKDITEKFTCKMNALNIAELQANLKDDSFPAEQKVILRKMLKAELRAKTEHECK